MQLPTKAYAHCKPSGRSVEHYLTKALHLILIDLHRLAVFVVDRIHKWYAWKDLYNPKRISQTYPCDWLGHAGLSIYFSETKLGKGQT